ncbi:hypothetical protein DPMN_045009 [Dreissena polymorpha]|uniref:Uncharacterized protein n=1 Tax=Dreissena polymorpha TaxID=45954 RepID=A0A9D4D492_DREPO|nr:hypothetical protein DPMN_045009 [Dreissena polymorpha]
MFILKRHRENAYLDSFFDCCYLCSDRFSIVNPLDFRKHAHVDPMLLPGVFADLWPISFRLRRRVPIIRIGQFLVDEFQSIVACVQTRTQVPVSF